MARRRGYYIPITRSGSSMLASVLTQAIDRAREQRLKSLRARLNSKEITQLQYVVLAHPILTIFCVCSALTFLSWIPVILFG